MFPPASYTVVGNKQIEVEAVYKTDDALLLGHELPKKINHEPEPVAFA
jgi:hypothetical protein